MAVKVITPTRKVERVRPPAPPEERVPFEPVEEPVKAVPIEPIKEPAAPLPVRPIEETHQRPGAGDMWIRKTDYEGLTVAQRELYDKKGWAALKVEIKAEAKREAERKAEEARPKPWGYYGKVSQTTWHLVKGEWKTQKRWYELDKDGNVVKDVRRISRDVGKKHLAEAQAARDAERKAGKTVRTIAYHLKKGAIIEAQKSEGGKGYADMTPDQQKRYTELIKRGITIPQAALIATTPVLPTIEVGEAREVTVRGKKIKLPAGKVYDLEKIAADPKLRKIFMDQVPGGRDMLIAHSRWRQAHIQTATGEWYPRTDLASLKRDSPDLYNILIKKGTTAYGKELKRLGVEAFVEKKWRDRHTLLPDGQWIVNTELASIKKESPDIHQVLTTQGYAAADALYKKELADYNRHISFMKDVAPYTDKAGNIDVAAAIAAGVGDRQLSFLIGEKEYKEIKEEIEAQPEALTIRQMGMELIPFYGRYLEYERVKKDGLTSSEIAWLVGNSALDILILLPLVGGVSAGARAAAGLGKIAVLKGVGKGIGRMALAEVKAPYTMIRHPIATAKAVIAPLKVIAKRRHIPISAIELRESTIRLPVKAMGTEAEAMRLRDITTLKAIRGEKAVATIGGTKVELERTAIQKLGEGIAVHSTPDIRPFMEGTIIKSGRGGGLFVSPNLHTRFATASAFGDMPQGGIRGGLIFKDPKLLKSLSPTGRIYRGTAEVEAMFKVGMKIPPPSQLITASDVLGDPLTLAVFGKPFTNAQLARLKLAGTMDTIGVMFSGAAKITKGQRTAVSSYDKLIELRQTAATLVKEAKVLRGQGKIVEAARVEAEARETIRFATRYAERISGRIATPVALRVALANYQRDGVLERWERVTNPRRTPVKAGVRRLGRGVIPERALARLPGGRAGGEVIVRRPIGRVPEYRVPVKPVKPVRPVRPVKPRMAIPIKPVVPVKPRVPPKLPVRPPVPPKPPRVPIKPPEPPKPPIPLRPGLTDKAKRKLISEGKGAFAFRMGELGKERDVWYSYISPYNKPEHRIVVVGKAPEGALIVRGPGSAIKTAQMLYGKALKERRTDDIGFMDAIFEPMLRRKGIRLSFKPDPKQETIGNFGTPFRITKPEPISPRVGSITDRRASISRGKGIRITPKVGRLR